MLLSCECRLKRNSQLEYFLIEHTNPKRYTAGVCIKKQVEAFDRFKKESTFK